MASKKQLHRHLQNVLAQIQKNMGEISKTSAAKSKQTERYLAKLGEIVKGIEAKLKTGAADLQDEIAYAEKIMGGAVSKNVRGQQEPIPELPPQGAQPTQAPEVAYDPEQAPTEPTGPKPGGFEQFAAQNRKPAPKPPMPKKDLDLVGSMFKGARNQSEKLKGAEKVDPEATAQHTKTAQKTADEVDEFGEKLGKVNVSDYDEATGKPEIFDPNLTQTPMPPDPEADQMREKWESGDRKEKFEHGEVIKRLNKTDWSATSDAAKSLKTLAKKIGMSEREAMKTFLRPDIPERQLALKRLKNVAAKMLSQKMSDVGDDEAQKRAVGYEADELARKAIKTEDENMLVVLNRLIDGKKVRSTEDWEQKAARIWRKIGRLYENVDPLLAALEAAQGVEEEQFETQTAARGNEEIEGLRDRLYDYQKRYGKLAMQKVREALDNANL